MLAHLFDIVWCKRHVVDGPSRLLQRYSVLFPATAQEGDDEVLLQHLPVVGRYQCRHHLVRILLHVVVVLSGNEQPCPVLME